MTLESLRLFRLFSVLITGVLALPALAADRKPVPSPSAPTINKQSPLATRQASLNPNRQVTDASKRQIAGHLRQVVQIKQASAPTDSSSGVASFYSSAQETAGGERFAPNALTVAHPTLPLGTRVRVTNLRDRRSVAVRINDRDGYVAGRAVDASQSAGQSPQGTTRQASLNPNRQVTDASNRQVAGHRRPAVQIKQASAPADSSSRVASFYSSAQETASGEGFAPNALTVAHPTLPLGTRVRVTNSRDRRSVVVRINDRDVYMAGRVVDVSQSADQSPQGVARQPPPTPNRQVTYASKRHIVGHRSPFVQIKQASAPADSRNAGPGRDAAGVAEPDHDARKRYIAGHHTPLKRNTRTSTPAVARNGGSGRDAAAVAEPDHDARKRHIPGHHTPLKRNAQTSTPAVARNGGSGRDAAAVAEPDHDARKRHIPGHHTPLMRNVQTSTPADSSSGVASFYSREQKTANGEDFAPNELTAAHRTLPFGTRVRVINLANGQSVTVRINDRGPYVAGRVVDVSRSAAQSLGIVDQGLAKVKLELLQ